MIYIVSHNCFPAAISDWPLGPEFQVLPVLFESTSVGYLHRINATTDCVQFRATHANNPIIDSRGSANGRLAGGKGAQSVEWIWREPKVASDNIEINPRHRGLSSEPFARRELVRGARHYQVIQMGYPCLRSLV